MTKLRRLAIAALAAATVTIGTLASVPTAAAMEKTCAQKIRSPQRTGPTEPPIMAWANTRWLTTGLADLRN